MLFPVLDALAVPLAVAAAVGLVWCCGHLGVRRAEAERRGRRLAAENRVLRNGLLACACRATGPRLAYHLLRELAATDHILAEDGCTPIRHPDVLRWVTAARHVDATHPAAAPPLAAADRTSADTGVRAGTATRKDRAERIDAP